MRSGGEGQEAPSPGGSGPPLSSVTVQELSATDRERVLELLLSQQRVARGPKGLPYTCLCKDIYVYVYVYI